MFTVRPVLRHFVLWLALAPLFLAETYALQTFEQVLALQNEQGVATALARITAHRPTPQGEEIRYEFQVPGRPETFHAADMTRWGSLWVPVGAEVWQAAQRNGRQISVTYLPENPWVNQAAGRQGYPLGDSFLTWLFFLGIDLIWLTETWFIARNYLRCQVAVERRQAERMRFWESRRLEIRPYY